MNGDLSLSQSLGGLRIANPDEEAVASPTANSPAPALLAAHPPPASSQSSASTITEARMLAPTLSHENVVEDEGIGFNPETYSLRDTGYSPTVSQQSSRSASGNDEEQRAKQQQRLSHRQSMPLGYQAQQAMQYPAHSSTYQQNMRVPGLQSTSTRPVSGMYMQQNGSASSGMSSQGSYRYRDDMGSSDGSGTGLARSGSRSAKGVLAGVMGRSDSRSYRSGSGQMNGGNGPLPPRRNSKRMRGPTTGSYTEPEATHGSQDRLPRTTEGWQERGAAATVRRETDASGQSQTRIVKKGVKDFNFGRTLGEGSYSTVLAATDRQTLKEYAIKVLDKRHIIKEKKVKYVNIERDTLNRLTEHPGIVRLYYTFQDERSLYFVLDLASGGELLGVLKKMGSFDVECTRFYGAQILDSVAYMHSRGVIHRDLKPENVLLDRDMHVKITDFGTAKILPDPRTSGAGSQEAPGDPTDGAGTDRAVSFVGTAEYVSPELLRDKNACKASDLWAFGCIIYQLLAGRPPFKAANEYLTFQKILALAYTFPDGFPDVARDLVERLLVLEPSNRLPVEHIQNHQFFDGVQWGKGLWQQKAPRLKAYVSPPAAPIKLDGAGKAAAAAGAAAAMNMSNIISSPTGQSPTTQMNGISRPQLRGATELPPPSQLDIDWSPVLHNNERILKLGNLVVFSGPQPSSPSMNSGEPGTPSEKEKPRFKSFFGGGGGQKKRERLVLITSSARIIIAAAGGNEKKAKSELSLLGPGTSWRSYTDAKGLVGWCLNTRDNKHHTFEDPRATVADPAGSKYSTQEWLDAIDSAREVALSQQSSHSSYSGVPSSYLNDDTALSSPADSVGDDKAGALPGAGVERHALRQTLRRNPTDESEMGGKGRKRFSKRHSKSGLAAVF
ncbi:serine/threonine protein kinase [Recurvomyces mirabilis]|uniref:non-specific serine/threonine protein kinase n=1 Tax=Recurvomyces mirabilis TaxID=574656 RepID=A0AAE1BZC6_9PEZI|nr:serine/threonine protein kinase [Recurvomyces mirabilis]KAK5153138.1 serine/threonine protein kinase [Recurvomyces mirabilis]